MNLDRPMSSVDGPTSRDFVTVEHPCLRRTQVPIWVKPPMTAAEMADPNTPIPEYAMGLIAYAWRDA